MTRLVLSRKIPACPKCGAPGRTRNWVWCPVCKEKTR